MKPTIRAIAAMVLVYSLSIVVLTAPNVLAVVCEGIGLDYKPGQNTNGKGPGDTCCVFTHWDAFGGKTRACIPSVSSTVESPPEAFIQSATPAGNPLPYGQDDWWQQHWVIKVCGEPDTGVVIKVTVTNAFGSATSTVGVVIPSSC